MGICRTSTFVVLCLIMACGSEEGPTLGSLAQTPSDQCPDPASATYVTPVDPCGPPPPYNPPPFPLPEGMGGCADIMEGLQGESDLALELHARNHALADYYQRNEEAATAYQEWLEYQRKWVSAYLQWLGARATKPGEAQYKLCWIPPNDPEYWARLGWSVDATLYSSRMNVVNPPFGANVDSTLYEQVREPTADLIYWSPGNGYSYRFDRVTGTNTFVGEPRTQGRLIVKDSASSIVYRLTDRYGRATGFDTGGRIQYREDLAGNQQEFLYTGGRLSEIRDPNGRTMIELSHYPSGRVASLTSGGVHTTQFSYDVEGNLSTVHTPTSTEFPNGRGFSFEYTSGEADPALNHNLTRVADVANATIVTYTHNADDSVATISAGNCTTTFGHQDLGSGNHKVTRTDPRGVITDHWFTPTSGAFPATVTRYRLDGLCEDSPPSWTYNYSYDAAGRVMSVVRPGGSRTDFIRDGNGNATEVRHRKQDMSTNDPSDLVETVTYDASNRPLAYTDAEQRTTTWAYNGVGWRSSVKGPIVTQYGGTQQSHVSFVHDSLGAVTSVTNSRGATLTISRDANGLVSGYTLAESPSGPSRSSTITRDTAGQITKITGPSGDAWEFTYDELGLAKTVNGPGNSGIEYLRDLRGRLLEAKYDHLDPTGAVEPLDKIRLFRAFNPMGLIGSEGFTISLTETGNGQLEYDANGNLIAAVSPEGRRTEYAYDEWNRVCTVTRGAGTIDAATTRVAWGPENLTMNVTDPSGRLYRIERDPWGPEKFTAPNGTYLNVVHSGRLVSKIEAFDNQDVLQARADFVRDALGRAHQIDEHVFGPGLVSSIVSHTRTFETNAPASLTDPLSNSTTLASNALGNLNSAVLSDGTTDSVQTGVAGRIIEAKRQAGLNKLRETFGYGPADVISSITQHDDVAPVGSRTNSYQYDSLGRLRQAVDPSGDVVRYFYDGIGNMVRLERDVRDSSGTVIATEVETAGYDKDGFLTSVVDGRGNQTQFSYDSLGRLTQTTFADTTTASYTYNADDTVSSEVDANGTVRTYTYDGSGEVASVSISPAPGVAAPTQISYTRDALGRVTAVNDGTSTVAFAYDSLGRILTETTSAGTTGYSYDSNGEITSILTPGGTTVTYGRNSLGLINSANVGATTLYTQTWNAAVGLVSRQYGNGVSEAVAHTDYGEPAQLGITIGATSLAQFDWGYDSRGDVGYEARAHRGGTGSVFAYDSSGQLVSVLAGVQSPAAEWTTPGSQPFSVSRSYAYDAAGARSSTSSQPSGGSTSSTTYVPTALNHYSSVGGTARAHDGNGNLLDDGTWTYKYDFRNLLIEVRNKAAGTVVGTYTYDALGRRNSKTTAAGTTMFVYEGFRLAEERSTTGTVLRTYYYGDGLSTPTHVTIFQGATAGTYTLHRDRLGSVVVVTDGAGALVETVDYDEFGVPSFFGPGGVPAAGSAIANNVLYTSQYWDAESLRYYYRMRSYDPATGAFLQRDPLLFVDGLNPFAYVNNSPTNTTDPLGLEGFNFLKHLRGHESATRALSRRSVDRFRGRSSAERLLDAINRPSYRMGEGVVRSAFQLAGATSTINYAALASGDRGSLAQDFLRGRESPLTTLGDSARSTVEAPFRLTGSALEVLDGLADGEISLADVERGSETVCMAFFLVHGLRHGTPLSRPRGRSTSNTARVGPEPVRIYSARELVRRRSGDPMHNFPESFNSTIFGSPPQRLHPGYHLYTARGTINGRSGTFEIGVRPSRSGRIEVIRHRFFQPD